MLLIAAAVGGCAGGAPWGRADTALFAVSVGCQAVDYAQTRWALEHHYTEINPILGSSPTAERLVATKVAMQSLIYHVADRSEDRVFALGAMLLPCLATVAHNYREGARP